MSEVKEKSIFEGTVFPATDWADLDLVEASAKYYQMRKVLLGEDGTPKELTPLSYLQTILNEYLDGHDWDHDEDIGATLEAVHDMQNVLDQLNSILGVAGSTPC